MEMMNSYMSANIASLQQQISTVMLDKSMNRDAQSLDLLLNNFQNANPVKEAPVNFEGTMSKYI